jgi:tellurite resistance protein TerC
MKGIPLWGWLAFALFVFALLVFDLFSHRAGHGASRRSAYIWSAVWIAAGLLFALFVRIAMGARAGHEYLAAYFIEKSLSLDNLFVFLIIFRNLNIPTSVQHNVLYWGIFGALVFRAIFIFLGLAAIERFEWITNVFAAILLWAAWRACREDPSGKKETKVVRFLSRHLPVTHKVHGHKFIARENGKCVATPLLIALLGLELTDIIFAIDSVPAALSVSHNRFVVYSSNVFAILGLRALYSAMAQTLGKLRYLHYGLAGVLAFAAFKMVLDRWVHIHPLAAVGITAAMIGGAVWASLRGGKPTCSK